MPKAEPFIHGNPAFSTLTDVFCVKRTNIFDCPSGVALPQIVGVNETCDLKFRGGMNQIVFNLWMICNLHSHTTWIGYSWCVCVPKVFYPLAAHKDAICQIKPYHTFYFWYFPSHPPWYGSFGGKRGFMMFMKKSTLVFHLGILAQLSAMKQPILESRTSNSNLPL